MIIFIKLILLLLSLMYVMALSDNSDSRLSQQGLMDKMKMLNVPSGFMIDVYSFHENITNPRCIKHIVFEDHNIVYLTNEVLDSSHPEKLPIYGILYALIDIDSDGINDNIIQIINNTDLNSSRPIFNIAIDALTQDLYIMTDTQMYVCHNMHSYVLHLLYKNQSNHDIFLDCALFMQIPQDSVNLQHGKHYSRFTTDHQYLCITFGMPCDVCLPKYDFQGQIRCYDVRNINNLPINVSDFAYIAAKGMRNSVGFDFHPITKQLWFTDNAATPSAPVEVAQLLPDDELNVVEYNGQHFGFPYCHSLGFGPYELRQTFATTYWNDPVFGQNINCNGSSSNYTLSIQPQSPHSAVLGMQFYQNKEKYLFPDKYHNAIFIAQHGTYFFEDYPVYHVRFGYRVVVVYTKIEETQDGKWINIISDYEVFLDGFFNGTNYTDLQMPFGRPVDIEILSHDGSMLVSDDHAGVVWRISYVGDGKTDGFDSFIIFVIIIAIIFSVLLIGCCIIKWYRHRRTSNYNTIKTTQLI